MGLGVGLRAELFIEDQPRSELRPAAPWRMWAPMPNRHVHHLAFDPWKGLSKSNAR
jgi:hypothetical protein